MAPDRTTMQNRLVRQFEPDVFLAIAGMLEHVDLPKDSILATANETIEYVYFLERGIGSIVATSPDGHSAEVGIFGREGFGPTSITSGILSTPFNIFMQVAGEGYRIRADDLNGLISSNTSLRYTLCQFAYVLSVQSMSTALSNAVHHVDERLARWLLMCHDRVETDEIPLTHEFIALMLAVRRPSVTTALHVLEGNHFIRADRGVITIRNRGVLEDFARDAYGMAEQQYVKILGAF